MAKSLDIASLGWGHFLRRVYSYKKSSENDEAFRTRIGLERYEKSNWFYRGDSVPLSRARDIIYKLQISEEEQLWLLIGDRPPWFASVTDSGVFTAYEE